MNPKTDKLVRTTMVATATAAYLLLTADYGPEPNTLDPTSSTLTVSNCQSTPLFYPAHTCPLHFLPLPLPSLLQTLNLILHNVNTHKPNSTPHQFIFPFYLYNPLNLFPKPTTFCFKTLCSQSPNPTNQSQKTLISMLLAVPNWADKIQEKGMRKKRSLYKYENWVDHRSSLRHIRHLLSSLNSRVILSLVPPVFMLTSVAIVIASYNSAVSLHWLPEFLPILRASSLPYQLTAPALALLLVFRTEASYSRYEEGRKAWSKVIVGTNDFARQVIASVDHSSDVLVKEALLQYIMVFPVALKCHVIYGSDIAQVLQPLIEAEDLAAIVNSSHRPHCVIDFISQSLRLLNLEESKLNVLVSKMSCFHDGIGVCEQLIGMPIPISYTRLTSRFLVLWHFTLPIILWDDCNWIVVPATFVSAASLFCIEEVGVLIEEPFTMLPLDELCTLVQNNVQEAITNEVMIRQLVGNKKSRSSREHSPNGRPSQ